VRFLTSVIAAAACALALTGCAGSPDICIKHGQRCENLPRPKIYRLNWSEPAEKVAVFRVRRLEVTQNGWSVTASITNTSKGTFRFPTGGPSSPNSFGLGVFTTRLPRRIETVGQYLLSPDKVNPAFPKQLGPGETWSGTMSGNEPPRSNRWLRVLFGVFFWNGKPPSADVGQFFAWQTEHTVRAPAPVGPDGG
jgi:hypothetical protein